MIKIKYLIKDLKLLKNNLKKKKFFLKEKKVKYLLLKYYKIIIKIKYLKKNNIIKKITKNYLNKIKFEKKKKLIKIPNICNFDNKNKNFIVIKKWGKKKYKKLGHIEIIKNFKMIRKNIDKNIIINHPLLNLYKSLINFILKLHKKEHNFKEITVNYILNFKEILNIAQLPYFKKELYKVSDNEYLIPTSESSVINVFKNKIFKNKILPFKILSQSKCFRNEKKNYGKKNYGLIRQKEFNKIELILITDIKNSYKNLIEIIKFSEKILKKLKIRYRIILLCCDDLGFSSSKTYDIEIWSPYLKKYIEISSSSNTEDFQSNRINLKYKYKDKIHNNHVLNSSSLAIGRLFSVIIENYYYNKKLLIPKILRKFNNFLKVIKFQ